MESFRCATCGNELSVPVRPVALPDGPDESLLDHHHVNPPRLEPGTYAIDHAPHGRGQVTGTFVLSPGDVRGTRFIHDLVLTGCWSLVAWEPCMACEGCGALVAARADDCRVAQETRFYPAMVLRETCEVPADRAADPFALIADWDDGGFDPRPRPELVATRWGGRRLKADLFRDDPPA